MAMFINSPFYDAVFHLTPQEKSVLAGFLTVCLLGAVIHCALNRDARPFSWVKTAGTKPNPPRKIHGITKKNFKKIRKHNSQAGQLP